MVAIAQLCYQLNTKGITFMIAANHLNSAISQSLDYQMDWHIQSTNTLNCDHGHGHSGGFSSRWNGNSGHDGHSSGCGHSATLTTPTKPNLMHLDFILQWNGTNFSLQNKMTRFGRSMTRKVNLVEPSISLATSPLNKSLPLSAPCNKYSQQLTPKRLSSLPSLRWETLLAARQMSRGFIPLNDWRWAQLTRLPLVIFICLWPTSLQIIVLFLFIICFHVLVFILILFSLGVNSILMPTLACLDATLFLLHTLAEFVMSPPTMPNMAFAERTCQSSLAWQHTLVNPADRLLFLWSMRACGLVPSSHILSSTKTNFDTMAS